MVSVDSREIKDLDKVLVELVRPAFVVDEVVVDELRLSVCLVVVRVWFLVAQPYLILLFLGPTRCNCCR